MHLITLRDKYTFWNNNDIPSGISTHLFWQIFFWMSCSGRCIFTCRIVFSWLSISYFNFINTWALSKCSINYLSSRAWVKKFTKYRVINTRFAMNFHIDLWQQAILHGKWATQIAFKVSSIVYSDSEDPSIQRKMNMLMWTNINTTKIIHSYKTVGHGKVDIQTFERYITIKYQD